MIARRIRGSLGSWFVASCVFAGACGIGESDESRSNRSEVDLGRLHEITYAVDGSSFRAALYVPAEYDKAQADWPLIVFLHGLGERGDDNVAQTSVGLYPAIRANPARFPCLVLLPQCPDDRVWTTLAADWAKELPPATDHIDAALEAVVSGWRVDRARIALTGLSMGGFGTLIHGATTIDRYCALVAVCGGGREEDASRLATKPLWLIHGGSDPIVPVRTSREMFEAVSAVGGEVKLDIYDGVGHDSWNRAYGDPRVIEFLLEAR